jgi:hypothetical protein
MRGIDPIQAIGFRNSRGIMLGGHVAHQLRLILAGQIANQRPPHEVVTASGLGDQPLAESKQQRLCVALVATLDERDDCEVVISWQVHARSPLNLGE